MAINSRQPLIHRKRKKKLQVTNHSWKLTSIRLSPGRNPFSSAAKILFLEVERHISSHSMGTHVLQTTRSIKIIGSSMKHTKSHFVLQFEFLRAPKIVQKPERNETFNVLEVSTNVYNFRSCLTLLRTGVRFRFGSSGS